MANILKIESGAIRNIFNESDGKIYYSIVDSVGIVAKTSDARNYWKVLKNRLKKAQNQLVTECNQLKMVASDGKSYLTDVATSPTIIKIIELISEEEVPYFRNYFDNFYQEMSKNGISTLNEKIEPEKLLLAQSSSYPQENFQNQKFEEKIIENENEFSLLVDAYHTNNFIFIKAFTAGASMKNISIHTTRSSVTISGTRVPLEQNKENEKTFSYQELFWGKFSRTLDLPLEVNEHRAEATEEDGFLIIKIPLMQKKLNPKVVRMRTI
jgi:HSP20 family molecular chaperone IbpA